MLCHSKGKDKKCMETAPSHLHLPKFPYYIYEENKIGWT